jgi:hypothetical protein
LGESLILTAKYGGQSVDAEWAVDGALSPDTNITTEGNLTIGEDEASDTLTVSAAYSGVEDSVSVEVVKSFYVSGEGKDGNTGRTKDTPFAALSEAYTAALADPFRKRIVVLSDLVEEGLVTLTPAGKTVSEGGGNVFILIEGESAGLKIERSVGANDSVLRIQGGAKITFKNITVNGKIAPESGEANANNRAIQVDGTGTVLVFGNGVTVTGKVKGAGYIDAGVNGSGIAVTNGGKLVMEAGSAVTGCAADNGYGAVFVSGSGSSFEMKEGSRVFNNTAYAGGGVEVSGSGAFTMYGGEISDNEVIMSGGGIHLVWDSTLTMHDGVISLNKAEWNGGGISAGEAIITMKGGRISGNTAKSSGGGIEVYKSSFTMEGGEISGNTATEEVGGGVFLDNQDTVKFTMTGGVIYGSDEEDLSNKTTAGSDKGAALYKSADAQIVDTEDVTGTTESTIDKRSNS